MKFLYIELDVTAYYNSNLISSGADLTSLSYENLRKYTKTAEMNKIGGRFKYSKLLGVMDNSSYDITYNITTVVIASISTSNVSLP